MRTLLLLMLWVGSAAAQPGSVDPRVRALAANMQNDACRAMVLRPAEASVEASARVAVACIVEACADRSTRLPIELQIVVRIGSHDQARARIVDGTLGSEAADRCVADVLGFAPFPRQAPARTRMSLEIRRPPAISTPDVPPPSQTIPQVPSRDDVGAAMRRVAPKVQECASGDPSPVTVTVLFRSDGQVVEVHLSKHRGTPVGRCIEQTIRTVRLPPFTRATFRVSFPYRL